MDHSLQSAHLTMNELTTLSAANPEATVEVEEEHHIHLPGPSWWPLLLSVAILIAVVGLLFIPDNPWITLIAAPFVLVGILGWGLEDPMATPKERHITSQEAAGAQSRFQIGQDVVDKDGNWIGIVQARFSHYLLVDNGALLVKAYYIPHSFIENSIKDNALRLNVSETDLLRRGLDRVPDDLYEETPDFGIPQVKGIPQYASKPLSPAETGHYNYGPNFPGINTDAAGSYYPEEVRPVPQKYVGDRRTLYATRKPVSPATVTSH
ncbi:MAG TPA: cytochrome c oxidase subunit 4 [Ktedonobacteraceae bacterium]|jgi:hypothetical protein